MVYNANTLMKNERYRGRSTLIQKKNWKWIQEFKNCRHPTSVCLNNFALTDACNTSSRWTKNWINEKNVWFQFLTIFSEFILIFIGSVLIQRQKAIADLFIFNVNVNAYKLKFQAYILVRLPKITTIRFVYIDSAECLSISVVINIKFFLDLTV